MVIWKDSRSPTPWRFPQAASGAGLGAFRAVHLSNEREMATRDGGILTTQAVGYNVGIGAEMNSPQKATFSRYETQDLTSSVVMLFPPIALAKASKGIVVEALGERFTSVQFLPGTIQLQNPFTGLTCILLPVRLELKKDDLSGLKDRNLDANAVLPKLRELFGIRNVAALGLNFRATFKVFGVADSGRAIIEHHTKLERAERRLNVKFTGGGIRLATSQAPYRYDFKFETWFQDPSRFYAEINSHRDQPGEPVLAEVDAALQEQYQVFESLIDAIIAGAGEVGE